MPSIAPKMLKAIKGIPVNKRDKEAINNKTNFRKNDFFIFFSSLNSKKESPKIKYTKAITVTMLSKTSLKKTSDGTTKATKVKTKNIIAVDLSLFQRENFEK